MYSERSQKIIEFEIDYILSEFTDHDTVLLLERTWHGKNTRYEKLKQLKNAILSGEWSNAREIIALLQLPPTAIVALNEHIAKELIWREGNSLRVVEFVKKHLKTAESVSNVAETLLQSASKPTIDDRYGLYQKVLRRPGLTTRLQELLDNALQFKSICTQGVIRNSKSACLKSYIYCDIYLNFLHDCSSLNCLEKLRILLSNVRHVNEFDLPVIFENLRTLLNQCVQLDEVATLKLLRKYPAFTRSISKNTNWNPLSDSGHFVYTPRFNYLQEYEYRRNQELPSVDTILELGRIIEAVKDPNAVSIAAEFDDITASYEPVARFPLIPILKISFGSQVWSLSSNWDGQLLAVGFASTGSVPLYSRNQANNWMLSETLTGGEFCERLSFNVKDRLLLSREGTIEARSLREVLPTFEVSDPIEKTSYGCICWHPKNSDLFYAARDSGPSLGLYDYRLKTLISQWQLPYSPSVIVSSGQHIAILTDKVSDHSQRLLLLDPIASVLREVKLPRLQADKTYSALESSQWDPRILLLMGSPNCFFLVDKLGQRPTRIIYGPKERDCMLKARFCGPMDKFIIASSEEPKDPKAYVYNRISGELVTTLEGHRDQVNDVEWIRATSTTGPCIATASDDCSVLIYGFPFK